VRYVEGGTPSLGHSTVAKVLLVNAYHCTNRKRPQNQSPRLWRPQCVKLKVREPGNRLPHTSVKSVISTRSAGFRICLRCGPSTTKKCDQQRFRSRASGRSLPLQQLLLALPLGSQHTVLLRYLTFRPSNRSLSRASQGPPPSRRPTQDWCNDDCCFLRFVRFLRSISVRAIDSGQEAGSSGAYMRVKDRRRHSPPPDIPASLYLYG
jgi:hypothetical protein